MNAQRWLVVVLRIAGVFTIAAFPAMLLPVDWMASTHARLGLGEFPRSAVVDYLARSIAALYGFHGVLVLLVSTDPVRYRPIVWFIAVMNIAFGAMLIAIDLHAGLPAYWTALEGPPIIAFGLVIALLTRLTSASYPPR
ncbi:MAG TPA: hypothetical protein VFK57_10075 [Vicinamibacterales bacterium]|nr:hypothetical protein [Vicinamibacterales bacterium]